MKNKRTSAGKVFFVILLLELAFIAVCNHAVLTSRNEEGSSWRVEVKRLLSEIESLPEAPDGDIPLDRSRYPHLLSAGPFLPGESGSRTCVVEEARGRLYRIEYETEQSDKPLLFMNAGFAAMLILTILVFLYIERKIVRPFSAMEKLAIDLARGNLSSPVREERSRIFGRFLWGMDMLREQLEENRKREMKHQKEHKTLMLSLSHDIKTPLSAISLYEKALSSGLYDTPEKQAEACAGIRKNVEELQRYIGQITAASREEFLALEVVKGEFYLEDPLTEIRNYYKEKFEALHTEFTVGEHGNPLLSGDRDRFVEVLQNILENAVKYGDGRRVRIVFSEEQEALLIHVQNTGAAPPEEERLHLFDSFYRGSNAGGREGAGLGLFISRELMKKMDGDIYVNTEDGWFETVVAVRMAG